MVLIHQELTKKILAACFEVINELGPGFLESVYHKALIIALHQKGLNVESEVPLSVTFRGQGVGNFYADLLVERKIILELKAISALAPEHSAQVINYLKGTGYEVGLLINFGKQRLDYRNLRNPDFERARTSRGILRVENENIAELRGDVSVAE